MLVYGYDFNSVEKWHNITFEQINTTALAVMTILERADVEFSAFDLSHTILLKPRPYLRHVAGLI